MAEDRYEEPEVTDYGTLQAMTEAVTVIGPEDGASKEDVDQHHSLGILP
jgi:hypothetical protein